MKKICVVAVCSLCFGNAFSQSPKNSIAIIPQPVELISRTGSYILNKTINIQAPDLMGVKQSAALIQAVLSPAKGYSTIIAAAAANPEIRLVLNTTADKKILKEGYRLTVDSTGVMIAANDAGGLFYGVQTFLQLLPANIITATDMRNEIPFVEINDYPRFGWRGLMLDVARHFFTKQEVKDFIDQMARYKFNLLHWHLADDEGWRIEIKSYPKLTTVGAWNVKKTGYFGTFSPPLPDEPRDYGGFYTQEDIKEVIQYARERFIDIMPEIDVPGHSLAAVASYPELSCTTPAKPYQVSSGEKIKEWYGGGRFSAIIDDNLCPANENVYEFLDKVFGEIAVLFPFDYIHVGGDECATNFWEASPAIKALMKRENMKTIHEVQGYFERRVATIIASKNKKLIGWDEILEGGGLAPGAAVMSWRGEKGGIEAARQQHEVVMSPTTFAYLDYMQADVITEPKVYASLRLSKAYQFDPVPKGVDPKYIKGGQANIWAEQLYNTRHLQYMVWPRALAISECVWSPVERKNFADFVTRVEKHFDRLKANNINYSTAMYDPIFTPTKTAAGKLQIGLSTEVDSLSIRYSFDNSFPDQFYPAYTSALIPPKDAVMLKLITYRGNVPMGRMISMPIAELEKRAGIKK